MVRTHRRRAGLSLMEALVALFMMAIGMISLLTLFPLGAIQMGRALRHDRTAQCAWQGDGVVRTWWQTEYVDLTTSSTTANHFSIFAASNATDDSQPSLVVALDPIGMTSGRSGTNLAGSAIQRKNSTAVATPTPSLTKALTFCSLLDDIFFTPAGVADKNSGSAAGNNIVRQGRYNWMALIQRPVNRDIYTANLKILVFDGRTPGTAPTNGEQLISVSTSGVGSTQVTVNAQTPFGTGPADQNFILSKGGWLLDPGTGNRMDFYRIQSITTSGTSAVLELDTPLKNAATQMVALRGLAEVYERPQLTAGGYKPPTP